MNSFKTTGSKLILLSCTCLALGACGTPQNHGNMPATEQSRIDSALSRAADAAGDTGNTGQSVILAERVYKRNPEDPDAAVKYARALREAEYYNRASVILLPFVNGENTHAQAQTENAAVQLALGNYVAAEKSAQQAIIKEPDNHQALHYLGIALDAQGMHKEAERAFRKGLDTWQGDPTPIINNLALNLASQGYLDEALELLDKALAVSPERTELERNYRIISALQKTPSNHAAPAPRSSEKPKDVVVEKAEVTEVQVEKTDEKSSETPASTEEEKPDSGNE